MSSQAWLWLPSPSAAKLKAQCERFARAATPLLIVGETGSGKSWLAAEIHAMYRGDAPFVPTAIGLLPEHLEQAELLGYVKGAFTGADRDRAGLVESASGGTLFLDEIGIASPALQQLCLQLAVRNPFIRRIGAARWAFLVHCSMLCDQASIVLSEPVLAGMPSGDPSQFHFAVRVSDWSNPSCGRLFCRRDTECRSHSGVIPPGGCVRYSPRC